MIEISSERVGFITNDPQRHFGQMIDDERMFPWIVAMYDDVPNTRLDQLTFHKVGLLDIKQAFFIVKDEEGEYILMVSYYKGRVTTNDFTVYESGECPNCARLAENYHDGPHDGCREFDPGPPMCVACTMIEVG